MPCSAFIFHVYT